MLRSWWCVREIASEKGLLDSWVLFRNDQVEAGRLCTQLQGKGGIKGRSPCRRRSRGFERSELPKKMGLLRSEAMRLRY